MTKVESWFVLVDMLLLEGRDRGVRTDEEAELANIYYKRQLRIAE
jgi:hypothetical protein